MAFRARPVSEDLSKSKIKKKTVNRRKKIVDVCEVQSIRRLPIFHKDPQHGMLPPWRQKESEAEEREESTKNPSTIILPKAEHQHLKIMFIMKTMFRLPY